MIGSGFAWQREMACCQVVSCPVGVRKLHCFQGHVFRGKRRVGWKSGRQQVCRCQVDDNEAVSTTRGKDGTSELLSLLIQSPIWVGGIGFLSVLGNRLFSQVAPVIDAGSGQSRADVICVLCSAVLVLTGLNWLQLAPKDPLEVKLDGEPAEECTTNLTEAAITELRWAWSAISSSTRCQSVVVFHQNVPVFQSGLRYKGSSLSTASMGKICNGVIKSGQANYLANLQLFPGGVEFLSYLPPNSQGVVVIPVGESGVMVVGTNAQRGIGNLDQAWLAAIAEKLGATLETEIPQFSQQVE